LLVDFVVARKGSYGFDDEMKFERGFIKGKAIKWRK